MATLTTFSAGTKVKSSEVNDNFTALNNQVKGYNTTGQTGHIVLTPGGNKLVKIMVLKQEITTDTYKANTIVLTGWTFKLGVASTVMQKAMTYGITFDDYPIVIVSECGHAGTSDPTSLGDFTNATGESLAGCYNFTTSGFGVNWKTNSGNFNNTIRYGATWMAIGEFS